MTVRDMVTKLRVEARQPGLTPIRAAEIAVELSSLLGNISEEITDAVLAYNAVFAGYLDSEGKANRAKIRAELSPEYRRKREAEDTDRVAVELVRSLRKLQDTYREEMRMQK